MMVCVFLLFDGLELIDDINVKVFLDGYFFKVWVYLFEYVE